MPRLSLAGLAIAVLVSPALLPPCAGAQIPPGEKIESFRSRLGSSSELKLTQLRLVYSPTITDGGIQIPKPPAAPESAAVLIPWSRVDRVGTEVSLAGRGALVGGLLGAAALGALAGAVSADAGLFPTYEVDPGAVAGGAVIGGLAGAALGALITAPIRRWGSIYQGPGAPSGPARSILVKQTSGQSVTVASSVIVTNPLVGAEGIAGKITSEGSDGGSVLLPWSAIDRAEVRGRSHVPGTLGGALLGVAIGLGVTSAVHFEPKDAQLVIVGCSLTGATFGWARSVGHGDWTEVYRRQKP